MTTDDLIALMAADGPAGPPVSRPVSRNIVLALAVSGTGFLGTLGLRADLGTAFADPVILAKAAVPLALGLVALAAVLRASRPEEHVTGRSLLLFLIAAAVLLAFGLAATPMGDWGAALRGHTMMACLFLIPMTSLLPLVALLLALRAGAPENPARAGFLAGLAAGGLATALYALHCIEDNPLFYVTWYGTGILIVAVLGRWIGKRWLAW